MKSALIAVMAVFFFLFSVPATVKAGCTDGVIENLKAGGACPLDFSRHPAPAVQQDEDVSIQDASLKPDAPTVEDQHHTQLSLLH